MNKQKKITLTQGCILFLVLYILIAIVFYGIAHKQLTYQPVGGGAVVQTQDQVHMGEIVQGMEIQQPFTVNCDYLNSLAFLTATYDRVNQGTATFEVVNRNNGDILATKQIDISQVPNNGEVTIIFDPPLTNVKEQNLCIQITSSGLTGNAITFWQRPAYEGEESASINNSALGSVMLFSFGGSNLLFFGPHYLWIVLIIGVLLAFYCGYLIYIQKQGKQSVILKLLDAIRRYKFLMQQLIIRDFKTKYKRSVLGVLWSFLNPLLLMVVQYIVFSTLFQSNIPNFPVYLLTGIVFFNFFNEACSMTLGSIVGNASLITKVYVPKYIYPISRVCSSTINFLLSFIPLVLVILFTKTQITVAYLLIPFGVLCLVIFCIGLGMLLASAMVYFRDMQFLWGVISTLWMYATPIFYPEDIVPANFSFILKLNPLYHVIRFTRIIILNGVSPEPKAYLFCLIFAIGMMVIGAIVFKKAQNKFVLYI